MMEVFAIIFGFGFLIFLFFIFWLAGLKVINQYERGIKFTLGKYVGIMHPGLNFVMPILQSFHKVDIRVTVVDVPDQDCITKDNVTIKVNAVLYYKVIGAKEAILEVEEYHNQNIEDSKLNVRINLDKHDDMFDVLEKWRKIWDVADNNGEDF